MLQNENTEITANSESNIRILTCSAENLENAVEDYLAGCGNGGNSKLLNDTYDNSANGEYSLASGFRTTANGNYSFAAGVGTITSATAQTVIGKYNAKNDDALFIVGNGCTDTADEEVNLIAYPKLYKINYIKIENGRVSIGTNSSFIGENKFNAVIDGDTINNVTIPYFSNGKIGLLFQFENPCYIDHLQIYGGVAGKSGYLDIYSLYVFDEFNSDCINENNLIVSQVRCDGEIDGVPIDVRKAVRYIALIMEKEGTEPSRLREIEAYGVPLNYSNAFTVNNDGTAYFAGDVFSGDEKLLSRNDIENELSYKQDKFSEVDIDNNNEFIRFRPNPVSQYIKKFVFNSSDDELARIAINDPEAPEDAATKRFVTNAIGGLSRFTIDDNGGKGYSSLSDLKSVCPQGVKGVFYLVKNINSEASALYEEYFWTGTDYESAGAFGTVDTGILATKEELNAQKEKTDELSVKVNYNTSEIEEIKTEYVKKGEVADELDFITKEQADEAYMPKLVDGTLNVSELVINNKVKLIWNDTTQSLDIVPIAE